MTSFPDPLTLPRPVIPAAEREQAARDRSQRILDMLPSREPTITERLAAEKRAEAERPDLFEQTLLGFETQTSIAFLARQVGRMGYDEDPDWDPFEDHTWAALTDGLPPDMWRDFAGSNSLAHAMKIREQNLALARKRELLASAGWTGTGASILASVLDPGAIAVGIATGGAAAPWLYGTRLTRLASFARHGLIAAASETAIEGYLATQDPQRGTSDVLIAAVGGGLLGGGLGALGRHFQIRAERQIRDLEYGEVRRFAMGAAGAGEFNIEIRDLINKHTLTDKGRVRYRDQIDPEAQRRFVDELIERSGLDPVRDAEEIARIRELDVHELVSRFDVPEEIPAPAGRTTDQTPEEAELERLMDEADPEAVAAAVAELRQDFPNMSEEALVETARRRVAREAAAKASTKVDKLPPQPMGRTTYDPMPGITPAQREAEGRLAQVLADQRAADAAYDARPESFGGKVLSTDIARELSPDFQGKPARIEHTRSTSRPAAAYIRDRFARSLDATPMRPDGSPRRLLLTAGGAGSGKSTALSEVAVREADLVLDNQGLDPAFMIRNIRAALDKGWEVRVKYVHRPFDEAMGGMIDRAVADGRWVSLADMPEFHAKARRSILKVAEEFADDPRVRVDAVLNLPGEAPRVVGIEELARLESFSTADPETLNAIAQRAIEEARIRHPGEPLIDRIATADRQGLGRPGGGGDGGGAQGSQPSQSPPPGRQRPPKRAGDPDFQGEAEGLSWLGRARRNFHSILLSSENPLMVRTMRLMSTDTLLGARGGPVRDSALPWVRRRVNSTLGRYFTETDPAFHEWAAARGRSRHSVGARDEFYEAVGKAIRRLDDPDAKARLDPNVRRAAEVQARLQAELQGVAERAGVKGFDRFDPYASYLKRLYSQRAIDAMVREYDAATVAQMFAGAIRSHGGIAEALARKGFDEAAIETKIDRIGKNMLQTLLNRNAYTDMELARLMSGDHRELMERLLRENIEDEEVITDILYGMRPGDAADRNLVSSARHRVPLDETYMHRLPDGRHIGFEQLLENNAAVLMNTYTREIAGASAMAEVFQRMTPAEMRARGEVIESFEQLKRVVAKESDRLQIDPDLRDRDLALLETLHREIRGWPINPHTPYNAPLRRLRAVANINMNGLFGAAQLPEIGNPIAEMGVTTFFRNIPAIGQVFKRAKDGQLTNEAFSVLERWMGLVSDHTVHPILNRLDYAAGGGVEAGTRFDMALRRANRATMLLSGQEPITVIQQKLTGLMAMQRLTEASRGKPLSARRLASVGLDQPTLNRIHEQVKKHARFHPSEHFEGRRILDPNIEAWDDIDAANKFIFAVDHWTRRAIQTHDIAGVHPFMSSELGKVLFQFRQFHIGAWDKQFLHKLQMHDVQAFMGAGLTSGIAAMVYVGQRQLESVTERDPQAYRDEHITPEKITKAAIQRGGWSSILPGAIETANRWSGGDPIFDYTYSGRSTGLSLDNNPSMALLNRGATSLRQGFLAVRGKDPFTDTDAQRALTLLPGQRLLGINQVIRALANQFPEDE